MTDTVSDPEFLRALEDFIGRFADERGLSWECAIEAMEAIIAKMQREIDKNR
jgi:uncharacterized protein (DUF2267 family)